MPYAYFLVGFILPSLLTSQPSLSNFLVVDAHLMSAISKFPSYCLVICIALLLGEEFGKFTAFASILPTLPYFLEDLVLPSLLTTKPSVSHSLVVNVELMLAILQFSSYCLLICIALLLANEFGEFASDICHIGRFAYRTPLSCSTQYIALLLTDEFGELPTFSRFIKFALLATCNEGPLVFS